MIRVLAACVAVLMALPLADQQADSVRSLVVHVRDDRDRPVSALVELRSNALRDSLRVLTSDSGVVALPVPIGSVVHLRVRAIGYDVARVRLVVDSVMGPVTVTLVRRTFIISPVCTTEFAPAIRLAGDSTLRTDSTLASIRVTDGAYVDAKQTRLDDWLYSLDFAGERPGRYTIEVLAPGFRPWRRRNVVVRKGECHVATRNYRVELVRLR